jgi:hypothetical protein
VGLLLAGGAVTAWQAVRLARVERDQALQQAGRSREVHAALLRATERPRPSAKRRKSKEFLSSTALALRIIG